MSKDISAPRSLLMPPFSARLALSVTAFLLVTGILVQLEIGSPTRLAMLHFGGAAFGLGAWWWRRRRASATSSRDTARLYGEVFYRSKDAVVISTPHGRIIDINQAGLELFGLPSLDAARAVDLSRDIYADPDQREALKERLLADRSVRDYPTTIRRGNELIEIEGSTSILESADGSVLFLAILRDISDRKREERELARYRDDLEGLIRERTLRLEEAVGQLRLEINERQRAEDERRRIETRVQGAQKLESLDLLAGGVAHDFNNLLVGILGNATLARTELPTDSSADPFLERIGIAARRAGELASQLLAYAGRGQLELRRCNLANLVREMTQLLKASVSKKASIELTLAHELPWIDADPTQLRQVVMNLITNASDALEDRDGVIAVRVGTSLTTEVDSAETLFPENLTAERFVFLEVADSGHGMDDETRKRIFDPFFTTKVRGRGLGMAAVLGIIRGHRATIQVHSEPAIGSRFVIQFPALEPTVDAGSDTNPILSATPPWQGDGLVLVVDDEPVVRSVATHSLRHLGFETIEAENGQDAISAFEARRDEIEFVLLDMNMPFLGGIETARALKRIRPDLPIILSSGEGRPQHDSESAEPLWSGWLKKPYSVEQVGRVLRSVLDAAQIG